MKKALIILAFGCALIMAVNAQDAQEEATDETAITVEEALQIEQSGALVDEGTEGAEFVEGEEQGEPEELADAEGVEAEPVDEAAIKAEDLYVLFDADTSVFSQSSIEMLEHNAAVLKYLAETLTANPDCRLAIDGHANPVEATQAEEEKELKPLSLKRAEAIADILTKYSIDRSRMTVTGSGGIRPVVPHDNHDEWYKNRRVEFVLEN